MISKYQHSVNHVKGDAKGEEHQGNSFWKMEL